MQKANFTDADIRQLTEKNPREAFAIRVRKTRPSLGNITPGRRLRIKVDSTL